MPFPRAWNSKFTRTTWTAAFLFPDDRLTVGIWSAPVQDKRKTLTSGILESRTGGKPSFLIPAIADVYLLCHISFPYLLRWPLCFDCVFLFFFISVSLFFHTPFLFYRPYAGGTPTNSWLLTLTTRKQEASLFIFLMAIYLLIPQPCPTMNIRTSNLSRVSETAS